jgi:hypothetical protein
VDTRPDHAREDALTAPTTNGRRRRSPRRIPEAARQRAASLTTRVEAARPHHATIDISFRAVDRDRRIAAGVLAGGIAYRFFLWSIPFSLVVAGGLGVAGSGASKSAAKSVGLTGAMVSSLGDAAKASKNYWWMLAVGAYLMIVTGVSALRALELVHAAAWGVPPASRRAISNRASPSRSCSASSSFSTRQSRGHTTPRRSTDRCTC